MSLTTENNTKYQQAGYKVCPDGNTENTDEPESITLDSGILGQSDD